jgi:prepilin-type N-terminal cleavage/methylation domain-containing protein
MTRRPERGFSVLEMLIAISVFGVFFFTIMDLWPQAFRSAQQARNVFLASQLAEQQMEYSIYQGYSALSVGSTSTPYTVESVVNGTRQTTSFTYTIAIAQSTSTLRSVLVSVAWADPGARAGVTVPRSIKLETLVSE